MAAGTEEGAPPDNQIATLYLGGEMGGDGRGDGRGGEETEKGDREQGETG